MNRQLGHGGGGAAWKGVRDIISQMYHGCTRWLSWHRGDSLLVGAQLRPSSVLRCHSNTTVNPPPWQCRSLLRFLFGYLLRNVLFWSTAGNKTFTAALELGFACHLLFYSFFLSFWKLCSRYRDTGEKSCKYCGVLVTMQRATPQLCRWNETPTSLMVNNSNNDVKDNYTNDASSSSWEI